MKTRTGFVSNSSSSSFVFVGVKRDKKGMDYESIEKTAKDAGLCYQYLGEKDFYLLGKGIGSWDDCGGINSINLTDLEILMKDIQSKITALNGGDPKEMIEIFYGMYYC